MSGLRLAGVTVAAAGAPILDRVDLAVPAGRILAIVGANGAGKTTLLDAISGTVPLASGEVHLDHGGVPAPGSARTGIGRVFQGSPLPRTLTVGEVVGLVADGEANAVMERFGLAPHETSFVAELSTGMRRILDLALASVGRPSILLLDEPSSGLAQAEIEHLAAVIRALRDETGATVVLVEHDAGLVRTIADEVAVMEAGRIVARGAPEEVLAAGRVHARLRIASAGDRRIAPSLQAVERTSVPSPPLVRRTVSPWTILRLGLREFGAGMGSVLILGVLSRVLKHELGISLAAVAAILASYNLAAPLGLPIGHRSDTMPILGRRREPYIVIGAAVTGVAVAAAPHVAFRLDGGVAPADVIFSVLLFVAMGAGMYGAGTAFFGLLADMTPPADRAHAAKVIYLELLAGVVVGLALTSVIVDDDAANLGTLFGLAGFVIVLLTVLAVAGMERRTAPVSHRMDTTAQVPFRTAVREAARMPQARLFFGFMLISTLFLFVQQVTLQPFGADVFGLSIRGTSGMTAMVTVGMIAGMIVAGRPFAAQVGHTVVARWGLRSSVAAFAGLALAAATESLPAVWVSLPAVGLSVGVFNVASLGLMMSMATRTRVAFFMGAWTIAHAVADGMATAGGGIVYSVAHAVTGSDAAGYAIVFGIEAVGLASCIPLLMRVDPERFVREAAELARPAEPAMGEAIPEAVPAEPRDAPARPASG